jgi:predicted dehydrogenase
MLEADVDAVFVATPIGLHAEHGRVVLAAGKHLWLEKPFTASLEGAELLTRMSRERGLTVGEGFMYLYHPQFARVRDIVQGGSLGYIHAVRCRFGIPTLEHPGFRADRALGGGAFLDVGSYPISAAAALFPTAWPDIRHADIVTSPRSAVDTAGSAVLYFPNGTRATLEWGTGCSYRNEIDIWGTTGSLMTSRVFSKPADYVPRFIFLDERGSERQENGVAENHFLTMFSAFRARVDDPAAAERERGDIVRRAKLADAIRRFSHKEIAQT